jgi:glycine cleavage system pyridoxal-binding protein P
MLQYLGFSNMDDFIAECVPSSIRISPELVSEEGEFAIKALSEQELLRRAKELGAKNKVNRSFIGMGYHQAVSRRRVRGRARELRTDEGFLTGRPSSHSSQHGVSSVEGYAGTQETLLMMMVSLRSENHAWFSQYSPYQVRSPLLIVAGTSLTHPR